MLTPEEAEAMIPYLQAIVEGKTVQIKYVGSSSFIDYRHDLPGVPTEGAEWRIKPATIKYRVALWKDGNGNFDTISLGSEKAAQIFEMRGLFVRWITGWIEVEV
jgi:hypothetical protein